MTAKIPLMAVAAIGGLVVGYSLLNPSMPEIRHAIPVKDEVNKAIPVDSGTAFGEVNLPPDTEIRSAKSVYSPVVSRRQPQQRLPSDKQVEILPNRRQPDTPKREDTEGEVTKAIAVSQAKDESSELKPIDQYRANVESDDDDDDDE